MERKLNITFRKESTVTQTIIINDECTLSDVEIIAGLNGDRDFTINLGDKVGDKLLMDTEDMALDVPLGQVETVTEDSEFYDFSLSKG